MEPPPPPLRARTRPLTDSRREGGQVLLQAFYRWGICEDAPMTLSSLAFNKYIMATLKTLVWLSFHSESMLSGICCLGLGRSPSCLNVKQSSRLKLILFGLVWTMSIFWSLMGRASIAVSLGNFLTNNREMKNKKDSLFYWSLVDAV